MLDDSEEFEFPEIVEIPIDGVLDLHSFNPREVRDLVPDYMEECRKKGILEVRIIHGKGKGVLKNIVSSILADIPWVRRHKPDTDAGNWGATIACLDPED